MRIEGDYIIFADGKKMYADEGCISVDNAGEICTGYSDGVMPGDLTDQEKWELSRYMIERWMSVRDKLWEAHEKTLTGLIGAIVDDSEDVKERVEADIEKLHEAIMGKDSVVDITGPFKKVVDLGQLILGFKIKEDPSLKTGEMFMMSEGETHNCRCSVVPIPEEVIVESDFSKLQDLAVWMLGCGYDFTQHPYYMNNKHLLTKGAPVESDEVGSPVEEPEIVDGPVCLDSTCFEYECMHKDGCGLTTTERDRCQHWKSLVAAKEYSCPVPDCAFTIKGRCAYVFPRGCGIRLNYINRKDFEVPVPRECNHDDCGLLCGKKAPLILTDDTAKRLMLEAVYCPECKTDTFIGLYKHAPDNWEIVEPRYCSACGWKENESKEVGK